MLKHKLLNKESIAKSMGIVIVFALLEKAIQLGRGIVFARVLGPEEYGIYTLTFIFMPLVVILAKLGIPSCYERYIPQYENKGKLCNFIKKTYLLTLKFSFILTVIWLLFYKQISKLMYFSYEYKGIVLITALTIIPSVLSENIIYSFNGLRIFKMGALLRFAQFLAFTGLAIVLVLFYPKASSVVLANLVAYLIAVSLFGFILWKYASKLESQNSKIKERDFYKKVFKYSIWFIITPLLSILLTYIDKWMLNLFAGLHEVGIYSIASNITGFVFIFAMVVGEVLMPNLSKNWEQGYKEKTMLMLNFALKASILFLFGLSALLVIFKRQIISVMYGKEYLESLSVINMLMVFWLFVSIFEIIRRYSGLIEKTHLSFIATITGLISNIILNFILIPKYKIEGAAIAAIITYGIMLILLFVFNIKEGMVLKPRTFFVCLFPLILLLNTAAIIVFYFIFVAITCSTNLILNKYEKDTLYKHIVKSIVKIKAYWRINVNHQPLFSIKDVS